jgi:hypothetical protein
MGYADILEPGKNLIEMGIAAVRVHEMDIQTQTIKELVARYRPLIRMGCGSQANGTQK